VVLGAVPRSHAIHLGGRLAAVRSRPGLRFGLLLAAAALVAGCTGDHGAEPTIASVDFTPRSVVVIRDDGTLALGKGEQTTEVGAVLVIRNDSDQPRRVRAGTTIDTGLLRPGDSTVVVLSSAGELELRERDDPARSMRLTVVDRDSPAS
jgi:hypothetical protein